MITLISGYFELLLITMPPASLSLYIQYSYISSLYIKDVLYIVSILCWNRARLMISTNNLMRRQRVSNAWPLNNYVHQTKAADKRCSETFQFPIFALAHRSLTVRSPFAHRAITVHNFALSAPLCLRSHFISVYCTLTLRSLRAQQSFSVRLPFRFNSSLLSFGTPKWKHHHRKHKKNERVFSITTRNLSKTK